MDRTRAGIRSSIGFALLSVISACGGGGGGGGSAGSNPTLSFAVTDSPSDDVQSFTLTITDMTITRLGGAQVGILATPATVDLASITDVSQLVSGGTVEAGTYIGGSITIDFTNAQCFLSGQTTAATILDAAGNPLNGQVTLPLDFGQTPLLCPFDRHLLLEYDFDLNQSCVTDTTANTISIDPAFVMHVAPSAPKPLLLGGTVTSVDTANQDFVGQLRTLGGTAITPVTITVTGTTVYQIDGVSSTGAAGLTALGGVPMPDVTWFEALGTIDAVTEKITASVVYAGHGTYNGGDDIIEGHVLDRTGAAGTDATLTVIGHSNQTNHTVFQFDQTFTVNTSFANTKVTKQGIDQRLDTDDLNVGQHVRIFGAVTGTTMDATAATSVARMQYTNISGHANGAVDASNNLEITLAKVGGRPQTDYTWADSGTPPTDPAHFVAAVGTLGTGLNIAAATPVWARGFFPSISDTGPDFQATSLANLNLVPDLMFVRNRPAGLTVAATAMPTSITLQISGTATTGEVAIIEQPFVGSSPLETSPDPTIEPPASGPRLYMIRDKTLNKTTFYLLFASFSQALGQKLGVGATIDQISAVGVYSSTTNVIQASLASAIVH
jgi:hypothetical protein